MRFDHLAVACTALGDGVATVEEALGVDLAPGGRHVLMSTHNRLLSLGPDEYLEVIAPDPDAAPPGRARWFGLDRFAGRPRPAAWIAATDSLEADAATLPGSGRITALSRGDFRWRMAIPDDGWLPFDGLAPALIQWDTPAHPAPHLPDAGIRLSRLVIAHPQAADLRALLARHLSEPRIVTEPGPPALRAEFVTPHGPRVLE